MADTSAGRCPPELRRVSLESAGRGESNGIGLEVSAWLLGGSFGVRYFDSKDLDRDYIGELVKKTRVM